MKVNEVKRLFLGLTNRCKGRCITCWHSNVVPFTTHDLDMKIYEQVRDALFPSIEILDLCGGGEVFLSPLFDQFISDARKYKFKTIITSSFTNIPERYKRVLSRLSVEFIVSLDGSTPELNSFLRPGCSYVDAVENIKYFASKGKKVTIQTTVCGFNNSDQENMKELARKMNVGIRFNSARHLSNLDTPYKFTVVEIEHPKLHWFRRLLQRVGVKSKRPKLCPQTDGIVKIQEDGKVLSCCLPTCLIMGDLNKDSLKDILEAEKYDHIRKVCNCKMMEDSYVNQ